MKALLFAAVFCIALGLTTLAVCIAFSGCASTPTANDCETFDYSTMHNGKQVTCRILWCDVNAGLNGFHGSGGATLWCE